MVNCRKVQKLYFEGDSQRTINISTGHSKNTVSDVVHYVKKLGIESLNDTMTNPWLEAFQLVSIFFKSPKPGIKCLITKIPQKFLTLKLAVTSIETFQLN